MCRWGDSKAAERTAVLTSAQEISGALLAVGEMDNPYTTYSMAMFVHGLPPPCPWVTPPKMDGKWMCRRGGSPSVSGCYRPK
jgi:hypothetical protein